ncbi:MAG: hypothetical protein QOF51_3787 [Chloroflexota bacterium]|nr:hypothetical protein [Chloroflexota bacterium]
MNGILALAVAAIPAFVGSSVEFIEALTIVLAVGTTRGWRAALWGAAAAAVTLAVIIAMFGTALVTIVPQSLLKFVVGSLLLLFGLKWLRKGILRFAGIVAFHDEELIYQKQVAALRAEGKSMQGFDKFSFFVSYKATLLEGMEVAFIVIAFGGTGPAAMQAALVGAIAAGIVVIGAGIALKQPLTMVPENAMKFTVGAMLVTFGVFWASEGLGVHWPLDAGLLPILFGVLCAVSWIGLKMLNMMLPQGARVEAKRI